MKYFIGCILALTVSTACLVGFAITISHWIEKESLITLMTASLLGVSSAFFWALAVIFFYVSIPKKYRP